MAAHNVGVEDTLTPVIFNIKGLKKSDLLELNLIIEAKNLNHTIFVNKKTEIRFFKKSIINHYRIHDILREKGTRYNEILLSANNVELENEYLSLEAGGVANGDNIKIIPVYRYKALLPADH